MSAGLRRVHTSSNHWHDCWSDVYIKTQVQRYYHQPRSFVSSFLKAHQHN